MTPYLFIPVRCSGILTKSMQLCIVLATRRVSYMTKLLAIKTACQIDVSMVVSFLASHSLPFLFVHEWHPFDAFSIILTYPKTKKDCSLYCPNFICASVPQQNHDKQILKVSFHWYYTWKISWTRRPMFLNVQQAIFLQTLVKTA